MAVALKNKNELLPSRQTGEIIKSLDIWKGTVHGVVQKQQPYFFNAQNLIKLFMKQSSQREA